MEDMLAKTERINRLLDFYLPMFNQRQQEMLTLYYRDDFSLTEIADTFHISRQAVHDQLHRLVHHIEQTETTLQLYQKNLQQLEILNQLSEKLQRLSGYLPPTVIGEITQIMQKLRQL